MPWGLEIDPANRPAGYEQFTTFHPTFLYEGLWNLAAVGVLLWMDRHLRLRPGKLFPAYVVLYFSGRAWVEELRIDTAARVVGLRWNFVLSLAMIVVGIIWFFWGGAARPRADEALEHADDPGQAV